MLTAAEILELQRIVREVPVSDHVIRYALSLVRQTRVREPGVPDFVDDQLSWGAGPAGRAVPDPRRQGPAPCCTAARTSPATTSRRWPSPCCGTAWC